MVEADKTTAASFSPQNMLPHIPMSSYVGKPTGLFDDRAQHKLRWLSMYRYRRKSASCIHHTYHHHAWLTLLALLGLCAISHKQLLVSGIPVEEEPSNFGTSFSINSPRQTDSPTGDGKLDADNRNAQNRRDRIKVIYLSAKCMNYDINIPA